MIWLIGNTGILGSEVEILLKGRDYISTNSDVDISDVDVINNFIKNKKIDWIINCSSYTMVDKAENESEKAFNINSKGVLNLAKLSSQNNIKLIHISTDYVFDGLIELEYNEDSKTNPINVYGKSKVSGEEYIKKYLENYYIIRTAWLYGKNKNNFVLTMLKSFNEREELNVVSDQFGSPTYAVDLAKVIVNFIDNNYEYGIYHYTNEGKTTWYDFSVEIYNIAKELKLIDKKIIINPISTDQYPLKAERPKNSYMSKDKIKKYIEIRNWKESLKEFMEDAYGSK